MLVPNDVLDCTVFLGAPVANDPDGIDLRCTAFLVRVPFSDGTAGQHYLVTVKHHADNRAPAAE